MKCFNWIKNRIPFPTEEKRAKRQEQLRRELSASDGTSELKLAQLELCTSISHDITENQSDFDWGLYYQWLFIMMPNRFAAACYVGLPVMSFLTVVFLAIVLGIKFFVLILPWFAMAAYFLFCVSLATLFLAGISTLLFVAFLKKDV